MEADESDSKTPTKPNNKLTLVAIAIISLLIASAVLAIIFAYEDFLELYFDVDSNNENEREEKMSSFIQNIIFLIIFLGLISFGIHRFFKFKHKESKPESKPEIAPTSKQNPKKLIFIYIILLPAIHAIIVMFSGDILHAIKTDSETTFLDLQNVFMLPAIIIWGICAKRYLWIWKKETTSEWFKIFGHDYIILERNILRKIIIGTLIAFIISLLLVTILSANQQIDTDSEEMQLWELFSLGIFFNLMIIVIFSFVKMQEQNAKKDFHLFIASGYCKKAIQDKGDLKSKYMREALKSYNNFFKRNHEDNILENVEKINIRILSKKLYTNSTIDELSRLFESGNNYLPLEKIAKLMNVKNKEDLLKNNSISERIRYWGFLISPVLGAVVSFLLAYFLTLNFLTNWKFLLGGNS